MDAKNLMSEVSSRFSGLSDTYKQGEEFAARAADKARDLYHQAEEQLPEGSMKYAALGLSGLTIAAVFYQLGKSKVRRSLPREAVRQVSKTAERARESANERMSSAKEVTQSAAQRVENFDFTPIYKLAKLWFIYKISI